jgi:hypothetical protein
MMTDWLAATTDSDGGALGGNGFFTVTTASALGSAIAVILVVIGIVVYLLKSRGKSQSQSDQVDLEFATESATFSDLVSGDDGVLGGTQPAPFTVYADNLWGAEDVGTPFDQFMCFE